MGRCSVRSVTAVVERLVKRDYRTILGLALMVCSASYASESLLNTSVVGIDDEYSNIRTSISATEWDRFDVPMGSSVVINYGDVRFEATFVQTYADVSNGDWLVLVEDDHLKIAISFGHACEIVDCVIGDPLTIFVPRHQEGVKPG